MYAQKTPEMKVRMRFMFTLNLCLKTLTLSTMKYKSTKSVSVPVLHDQPT